MTDRNLLYEGISKCAWAYFFCYLDINLGNVSILPDFVAFWLFLSAIELLQQEERELKLLKPLGRLLLCWHICDWLLSWIGGTVDGLHLALDLIICLANLYFHFQLLTNLASIAAKHQPKDEEHDGRLLSCRSWQTVLLTVAMLLSDLSPWFGEGWVYVSLALVLGYLIAGLCLMGALFSLRKCFLPPETA